MITVAVVVASPFPVLVGGGGVEVAYFEKMLSTFGAGYLVVEAGLAAPEVLAAPSCETEVQVVGVVLFGPDAGGAVVSASRDSLFLDVLYEGCTACLVIVGRD